MDQTPFAIGPFLLARGLPLFLAITLLGASKPLAPCTHVKMATKGWRTERFDGRLSFRLPPTFARDMGARFIEGGRAWVDGTRGMEMGAGFWGEGSFGKNEHGPQLRSYGAIAVENNYYHRPGVPLSNMGTALEAHSRSEADLRLFLAIFRTLHIDSTTAWGR